MAQDGPTSRPRLEPNTHPAHVGAILAALGLLTAIFAGSTIPGVRPAPGFSTPLDGWLQGGLYVGMGGLVLVSLIALRPSNRVWSLLGWAIVLRALGFVLLLAFVRLQSVPAYPSVADACWLLSSLVFVVVVVARAREQWARISLLLLLDAAAGALLVGGVAFGVLLDPLTRLGAGVPVQSVVVNLVYPVIDVATLAVVLGMLLVWDWRIGRADRLLALGVVGVAIGDVAFLILASADAYRPGTWVATLSLVSTGLLTAAYFAQHSAPAARRQQKPINLTVPAVFGLVALGVLVYSAVRPVPFGAVLLVAVTLATVLIRGMLTVSGDRALADIELRAKNDALLRFQALVEASDDFIAIAGMDGKVIYVNPSGRELVGLEPDRDVETTTIADYLTEEGQRASVAVEQPAVVATGRWTGESTLRDRRGGPPIPVAISSFLMFHPNTGEPFALATVQRDITERLAAQRALEDLAGQRQTLLARLVQAQEDERTEIAADVHDDSVQALAAVDLRLGLLRRQLGEVAPDLVPNADKALETVQEATSRLRHLLFDLESPALHDDLATALTVAADYVFEGTEVSWRITGDRGVDLPTPSRVTAYRIAKEALSNVRRHAQATKVDIGLARDDDGVLVTVTDDGIGMTPGDDRHRAGHRGLSSSRDRATVAGGWLRVDNSSGEGTRVVVWLPVVAPSEHDDQDRQDGSGPA